MLDLPSSTFEEAPFALKPWLRQRRRWFKGWAQTAITHARQPLAAIRIMGFAPWLVAQLQIGGLLFGALFMPFFTAWAVWNIVTGDILIASPPLILLVNSLAIVIMLIGSLSMLAPAAVGIRRRRAWHFLPWLPVLVPYVLLISAAAWLSLWDLARRPFHWAKTEHGVGRRPGRLRSRR